MSLPDLKLEVDVIITNHNYSGFLDCALDSLLLQEAELVRKTIVVDDASDRADRAREICELRGISYLRTEYRSPHLARGAGCRASSSSLICFLDADNCLPPDYLSEAIRLFNSNPRVAIVYPDLRRFGDTEQLFKVPQFDIALLEQENYIDTGAVWRREAIEQASLFEYDVNGWEDWWCARRIFRSANWTAAKSPAALQYRTHAGQRTRSARDQSYYNRAHLATETITIFMMIEDITPDAKATFQRQQQWIVAQSWPKQQVRILLSNLSRTSIPLDWFDGFVGVGGVSWHNQFISDCSAGMEQRRTRSLETAVAAAINQMLRCAGTEFVLCLGRGVIPHSLDTIERLLYSFDRTVGIVSGVLRPEQASLSASNPRHNTAADDSLCTGFDCLMIRRSQVADEVVATRNVDTDNHYAAWFCDLRTRGRNCRTNPTVGFDVVCPEGVATSTPPEPVGDKLHELFTAAGQQPPQSREYQWWRNQMNQWGAHKCAGEFRQRLIEHFTAVAREACWLDIHHPGFTHYPTVASMLDDSIRRSMHDAASSSSIESS